MGGEIGFILYLGPMRFPLLHRVHGLNFCLLPHFFFKNFMRRFPLKRFLRSLAILGIPHPLSYLVYLRNSVNSDALRS